MIQDGMTVNVGDPFVSETGKPARYFETSQRWRGLKDEQVEVGLMGSTRSAGKPRTWGSDQQRCNGFSVGFPDPQRLGT